MNPTIQLKQSVVCPRERLTKTKILRNIFLSVGVLFASVRLLSAGMNDGVLNFTNTSLVRPQATFITFDAPGGHRDMLPSGINPAGAITGTYLTDAKLSVSRLPAGARRHLHHLRSARLHTNGPIPMAINPAGTIAGTYFDASGVATASCGPPTAPSPPSIPQAPHSPSCTGINPAGTITGSTLTQAAWSTASCALPTAPSPRSMPRAPSTAPSLRHQPGGGHHGILL